MIIMSLKNRAITGKMAKSSTSFKPGKSGNPKGRPPSGSAWSDILREIGEEVEKKSGQTYKELVGKRLWVECVNGNISAIKELFNRMDGMPKQQTELQGAVNVFLHSSLKQEK